MGRGNSREGGGEAPNLRAGATEHPDALLPPRARARARARLRRARAVRDRRVPRHWSRCNGSNASRCNGSNAGAERRQQLRDDRVRAQPLRDAVRHARGEQRLDRRAPRLLDLAGGDVQSHAQPTAPPPPARHRPRPAGRSREGGFVRGTRVCARDPGLRTKDGGPGGGRA